ncbi:hypothetical protein [Xanthomonas euroxanthea]|uniref:hypothetical protein n=1 Tax=Xanthomonas euroxanthea TaxID=2259622 RepID=UPI000E206128|nr:hypothetical protein [Xanthomonas euroxanthea]CAE1139584.1 hypothetical protein XTG_003736 [Xanthomonas euroxanthea]
MSNSNEQSHWRERAEAALWAHEIDGTGGAVTVSGLARAIGVSRQTIWRDKRLMERIAAVQDTATKPVRSAGSKGALEARLKRMEVELRGLRSENEILLFNIMAVAKRLREAGLDPGEFFGAQGDDARSLSKSFLI